MQRTVKTLKVQYLDKDTNGQLVTKEFTSTDLDENKVARKLAKSIGHSVLIVSSEVQEDLWVLDDEIFFKYAQIKKPE